MSGSLCFGSAYNNAGKGRLRSSKAFCEGLEYRAGGTAAGRPKTDNPGQSNSDVLIAWYDGWDVAQASAGGQIPNSEAPCCATGSRTILA